MDTLTVKKAALFNKPIPDDIERDMEEMAAQGWSVSALSDTFLATFEKKEPARVRFVADYVGNSVGPLGYDNKELSNAGYRRVCHCRGWFLWVKEYEGDRPQVSTNLNYLIEKLGRDSNSSKMLWATNLPLWAIFTAYWLITHGLDTFLLIMIPVMAAICIFSGVLGGIEGKKIEKRAELLVDLKAKGSLR